MPDLAFLLVSLHTRLDSYSSRLVVVSDDDFGGS